MLAARRSQLQAMEDRQQYRPQGWSASRGLETAGKSQCYSCQSCGGIDLHRAKHSHVPTANFRSHIEPHPSCAFSEGEAGVQRRFTFQPRCRLKSPWESFESGHGRLRHLSQILSSTHLPWRLDKYQPTRHTSFGSEKHAGGWHRPLSSTSHPTNRPLRCARVILAPKPTTTKKRPNRKRVSPQTYDEDNEIVVVSDSSYKSSPASSESSAASASPPPPPPKKVKLNTHRRRPPFNQDEQIRDDGVVRSREPEHTELDPEVVRAAEILMGLYEEDKTLRRQ
jgi:hypothetical protein